MLEKKFLSWIFFYRRLLLLLKSFRKKNTPKNDFKKPKSVKSVNISIFHKKYYIILYFNMIFCLD